MSKVVLMSIQPKWCMLIADGYKTIEIRKSRPKLKTPFKVYIYCTKEKICRIPVPDTAQGKVIGEFTCELIERLNYNRNGYGIENERILCVAAQIGKDELYHYLKGATPYGWYIPEDVVIYDTPKELSDFGKTRPPQSWCYVEDGNKNDT